MNKITKLALILLIAFAFTACKKDEVKPDTDTTDTTTDTEVVDTQPMDDGPICCNPEDLDNPDSLLSQRIIYFDFDQSTIRAEFRDLIALHGRYLSENPSARMTLEGHADERGSREYNLALGERRGNSVANLLRAEGASNNQINVVSYGEERPVATCSDESCWSQNRRAVIVYTAK